MHIAQDLHSARLSGESRFRIGMAGVILLYVLLASGIAVTKRPGGDEVFYANPALDLMTRGKTGLTVVEPTGNGQAPGTNLIGIRDHLYTAVPLPYFLDATWFKVAGFSLTSLRALSILFGVLALVAWLLIVQTLSQSRALTLLSVFLIAVDRAFLDAAADGRPDMMSASFSAAAVAAYVVLRERNLGTAVFAGHSLMAASLLCHPVGGIGLFALLLFALHFDWRRLSWRHMPLAILPYLVGAAGWGLYISIDPAAFHAQFMTNESSRLEGLTRPWIGFINEIRLRYADNFYLPPHATGIGRLRILVPIIYAGALIVCLVAFRPGKHKGHRLLLILAVVYFAAFSIFEGHKSHYYLVHMTPALACCLAVWFYLKPSAYRRVLIAAMLVLQVAWVLLSIRQNPYQTAYIPAVDFLTRRAGTTALIIGPGELGFSLGFYNNLIDDATLGFYSGKQADYIVVDERSYKEAFKEYQTTAPDLHRYVTRLLTQEYRKVYTGRVYEIYTRR